MDPNAAKEALIKALDEYDNGTITRAATVTIIEETTKNLYDAGYNYGLTIADDDVDDELDDDEYEIELDDDEYEEEL